MPKKGEKKRKIKKLYAGEGVRAPKTWWDEIMGELKKEKKYKKFSKPRLQRIVGGIWKKEPQAAKIKIVREYQR